MKHLLFLFTCFCVMLMLACSNTQEQTSDTERPLHVDTVALRHIADSVMQDELQQSGAKGGRIMVMEVATGSLVLDYRSDSMLSVDAIVPGALIAVPLLATLLDDTTKGVDTAMRIRVGTKSIPGETITDSQRTVVDSLPLSEAFGRSAIALCELGDLYASNPDSLTERFSRLFPSARMTDVRTNRIELYRLCRGYGISIPAQELLLFYASVGNNGVNPITGQRVCSPKTADILCALMKNGKETTTEILLDIKKINMFVGYVPGKSGREFVCLVIFDSCNSFMHPAKRGFERVSERLTRYLNY